MCYVHNQWYDISCAPLHDSVHRDKHRDSTFNHDTTITFHLISRSLWTSHPTIRIYIVWGTEIVVKNYVNTCAAVTNTTVLVDVPGQKGSVDGWQSVSPFVKCKTLSISLHSGVKCRSQWPRGLRRRSLAARLLRLWVRIPPGAWIFVCCECCVLSGRGLCNGLIIRSEESYRMWRVVVCDQESSQARRLKPIRGL